MFLTAKYFHCYITYYVERPHFATMCQFSHLNM